MKIIVKHPGRTAHVLGVPADAIDTDLSRYLGGVASYPCPHFDDAPHPVLVWADDDSDDLAMTPNVRTKLCPWVVAGPVVVESDGPEWDQETAGQVADWLNGLSVGEVAAAGPWEPYLPHTLPSSSRWGETAV